MANVETKHVKYVKHVHCRAETIRCDATRDIVDKHGKYEKDNPRARGSVSRCGVLSKHSWRVLKALHALAGHAFGCPSLSYILTFTKAHDRLPTTHGVFGVVKVRRLVMHVAGGLFSAVPANAVFKTGKMWK